MRGSTVKKLPLIFFLLSSLIWAGCEKESGKDGDEEEKGDVVSLPDAEDSEGDYFCLSDMNCAPPLICCDGICVKTCVDKELSDGGEAQDGEEEEEGADEGKEGLLISPAPPIEFGDVAVSETVEKKIELKNISGVKISVAEISTAKDGAFKVGDANPELPYEIPPGEILDFALLFTPPTEGEFKESVAIIHPGYGKGKSEFSANGVGVSPPAAIISVSPETLDFGKVTVGESSEEELEIKNTGDIPLDITNVTVSTAATDFTVESFDKNVEPLGSGTVKVKFTPTDYGEIEGTLSVESNAANNPRLDVALEGLGGCKAGEIIEESCGNCGKRSRECDSGGNWSLWSECGGEGCAPGVEEREVCGICAERVRKCGEDCAWSEWGLCPDDECAPQTEEVNECNICGEEKRICDGNCKWSKWSECSASNADGATYTYEPNDVYTSAAKLPDVSDKDNCNPEDTFAKIVPRGDVDWFIRDLSDDYGYDMGLTIRLNNPIGQIYSLQVYYDPDNKSDNKCHIDPKCGNRGLPCVGGDNNCPDGPLGQAGCYTKALSNISISLNCFDESFGGCGGLGCEDSGTIYVRIAPLEPESGSCEPYGLEWCF
ncbi:MAG: hypothetical protein Kow0090_05320 [Myxococcota bacterium]